MKPNKKKMKQMILKYSVGIIIIGMMISSCAPVFSELQSARMVGKNKIEATPSISSINFSENGDSKGIQNHFGLQFAYGLSTKVDLRFRYEYIWMKGSNSFGDGASVLAIGPKFSLIENKLAFNLPLGRALAQGSGNTWQIHPTLLLTIPAIEKKMDINFSTKYLMTFCKNCDDLVALNLGFAISSNLNEWSIRPEYGLLINPGESGKFGQFSLGFTKSFGK